MLRSGGVAVGNFKIGGTVYVFSDKGVYSGQSHPEDDFPYYSDAYGEIMGNTTVVYGKKYGDVFGGIKSTDGSTHRITVGLTDLKYADAFKGFAAEPELVTAEKVKYSMNELYALHKFVSDNCFGNGKYSVTGVGVGYNIIHINVLTEEDKAATAKYLEDNGYGSDMFEIETGGPSIPE